MPREARLESAGAVYHFLDRSRGRDEDWRDSQTDPYSHTPVNISGTVAAVTANALNQYTQVKGVIPQYDGNFNLKVYGAFGFNYDAEKRLTSATKSGVTQVECTYDGLGRVVRRIEQGVTTLYTYDEWKAIVEWDGSGTMVGWNVYGAGADEILWRWRAGIGYLRYHADRMGNVTSMLDLAGNIIEQYSYDAYGMPTITSANNTQLLTSAIGNRFMFTGREYLSSIVSYDYRHRMYRPNLGRFLQTDPIGFDAGDMNLFRYCGYDPVDRTDPTGLYVASLTGWGGGDWIKLGIIPERDNQLISEARAMDSIVAQMSDSKNQAPKHGTKEYKAAFDAAVSVATEAMQLAKSGGRAGTEAWASFGKDPNTNTYGVSSVRRGSGENPNFKDDYTEGKGERVQTSGIARGDLAERYNMTGFVLAHRYYNDTYVQKDLYRARDHQLSALIVLPPRPASSTTSPILRWWEYGTPFPNF